MNLLERIPKENDKVNYGDWEITVLEMNGKRVEKAKVKKCLPTE